MLLTVKQQGIKYTAKGCMTGHSMIAVASVRDWVINFKSQWFMQTQVRNCCALVLYYKLNR